MKPPRAVLTGATGFLGLHLLPALLKAGFEVRILARRDPAHPAWDGLAFETIRGDLADAGALAALVQDADVVIHAAGLIKARSRTKFLTANRDGTAALAQAARNFAPSARFLLISSLVARAPDLSDYGFSKHQAELAAESVFVAVPAQLAILRPPAIYGPWDRETLAVFQSSLRRVASVPGRAGNPVIHVSDAAAAITALAGNWRPGRFTLADARPQGYRMREILQAAAKATGGRPLLLPVPDAVVLAAGYAARLRMLLTGHVQIFGPGKAREIVHPDWGISAAELLPPEIFVPRISMADGFAETVAWYQQAGWL